MFACVDVWGCDTMYTYMYFPTTVCKYSIINTCIIYRAASGAQLVERSV